MVSIVSNNALYLIRIYSILFEVFHEGYELSLSRKGTLHVKEIIIYYSIYSQFSIQFKSESDFLGVETE